eukprot:5198423-Pyramimonas_sp.AAC.1
MGYGIHMALHVKRNARILRGCFSPRPTWGSCFIWTPRASPHLTSPSLAHTHTPTSTSSPSAL